MGDKRVFTVGDCFAGIGGFSLVFEHLGCKTAWFIEREPYCQQVLKNHFSAPIYGDIYENHFLPHVDIFVAGFPCQPFSQAGRQRGTKDSRYVIPEMLRLIREVKPNVILLENVPGFTTLDAGESPKRLLWSLVQMGYDAVWGSIRASDAGAPHRRERWFLVAYPSSFGRGQSKRFGKRGYLLRNIRGNTPQSQPKRSQWFVGIRQVGTTLEYPNEPRMEGSESERREEWQQKSTTGSASSTLGDSKRRRYRGYAWGRAGTFFTCRYTWTGRKAESRLGGTPHGLPYRLDEHQFPALPKQEQYPFEPPRVTTENKERKNRLKALGNSIVPQA